MVLIIAIPLPMVTGSRKQEPATAESTEKHNSRAQKEKETTIDTDYVICTVMQYIDESAHPETKKALLTLCKNNYVYLKANEPDNLTAEITRYSDSFYDELKEYYKDIDVTITYKGKIVYIPITKTTSGFTVTDENYPYMVSVASPWDVLSAQYYQESADIECGVSISGMGYLCENGDTFTEALHWYLPDFEITKESTA